MEDSKPKYTPAETEWHRISIPVRREIWTFADILPPNLTKIMCDDYDKIRAGQLTKVPAEYTIDRIIRENGQSISSKNGRNFKETDATVILDRFNSYFGQHLIYEVEREQYKGTTLSDATKNGHDWESTWGRCSQFRGSAYYGVIHFLRWIMTISTTLDKGLTRENLESTKMIVNHIRGVVKHIGENIGTYLTEDYYQSSCK